MHRLSAALATGGSMENDRIERRPLLEIAAGRLRKSWPAIAAASIACLALDFHFSGSGIAAAGAVAFILIAAILIPGEAGDQPPESNRGITTRDPEVLPATYLAGAVPDPLFLIDSDGAVVHANEAAQSAFGAVAIGGSLRLKFRAPEMQDFIDRILRNGEPRGSIDYTERVPIERAYRVSAMPVGEDTALFVLHFRDQSEARRIDRMRADFIANASHELRTPLASVAGFIETLRGPARDDAKAQENFLQIMQDQTARMARLIDDLLSLSRLEIKPYAPPRDKVDLKPLLEEVRESLSHLAAENEVELELQLPDTPLQVAGNRDELVQVFANLMENACKYGASGERVVISAVADEKDGETAVTVTDFGPGIEEEHIPRITERFYRVDVESSLAQKGTGLGLSIVKHILTRHGARLSIRSKPGEGSSFTVHFPPMS